MCISVYFIKHFLLLDNWCKLNDFICFVYSNYLEHTKSSIVFYDCDTHISLPKTCFTCYDNVEAFIAQLYIMYSHAINTYRKVMYWISYLCTKFNTSIWFSFWLKLFYKYFWYDFSHEGQALTRWTCQPSSVTCAFNSL